MDISLDDYIRQNDFKKPFCKKERGDEATMSKFDRYNRDAGLADVDEDDDDDVFMDVSMEMPRLVPIKPRPTQQQQPQQQQQQQQRLPVHERLGRRDSMTSSIAESVADSVADSIIVQVNNGFQRKRQNKNNLKRLNNNGRVSVQHRLNKNFVNPAIVARNNFSVNAINSFMESAMKTFGAADPNESLAPNGNFMAALATRMMTQFGQNKGPEPAEQKYNMSVQKEISAIQGKQLFYKCPGASVVSCDGPGVDSPVEVPQNQTGMSLNQRFA